IPSPNVAEDHQTKNAKAISDRDGAILLKEIQLDTQFQGIFSDLMANGEKRQKLRNSKKNGFKPDT
ncbi:MAG: UDP-N-acetylglucosamine--N-acetylmuramyl-(pentapeptide) pyrophosphoryl-undecaprenol N-acetylglucosamine transferase, partial [Flavobacterium sp.]